MLGSIVKDYHSREDIQEQLVSLCAPSSTYRKSVRGEYVPETLSPALHGQGGSPIGQLNQTK